MSSRRPHEPEQLTVVVARRAQGGFILSVPMCPGWAVPARTPQELALRLEQAWSEAACAAYARLRGALYDLAATEERIPVEALPAVPTQHPAETPDPATAAQRKKRARHPATHDPEQWVELPDGCWLSPRGQRYRPETRVAAAVRQARRH